jgi:hypothetical protein
MQKLLLPFRTPVGLLSGYKSKTRGSFSLTGPLHSRHPCPRSLFLRPSVPAQHRRRPFSPVQFSGDNGRQEPAPSRRRLGRLLSDGEEVGRVGLRWVFAAEDEPVSVGVESAVV